MSSHTLSTILTIEKDGNYTIPTQEVLCPGWEDTLQMGYFPTIQDSCRPCNPREELWIAAEFNDNIGLSVCLPDAIDFTSTHKQGIMYTGIMIAVYCLVYFTKTTKKTRK
jgi:hypothetical protein